MRTKRSFRRGRGGVGTDAPALAAVLALLATAAAGQNGNAAAPEATMRPAPRLVGDVALPSGRSVRFFEVVTTERGEAGLTYRFRFVAPWIAEIEDFGPVAGDMEFLCTDYALARLSNIGPQPPEVVISLSEAEVEFGETRPDIVQFFEAYRIENGTCLWEYL